MRSPETVISQKLKHKMNSAQKYKTKTKYVNLSSRQISSFAILMQSNAYFGLTLSWLVNKIEARYFIQLAQIV